MPEKDKRIDAYISKAAPFAQPILMRLRKLIHKGCPGVQETIKWGMPSFDYKGPFFSIAAFKEHCACGFWKSALIEDDYGYLKPVSNQGEEAMGNFGRIASLKDLPPDSVVLDYIRQAKQLNDDGVKMPARKTTKRKTLPAPDYMLTAIGKNKKAWTTFEHFSPTNKRDYIEWITEAKIEATRDKRLKQAIEWMAEGKPRNWKYMPAYR